jgi:hypothetical protein
MKFLSFIFFCYFTEAFSASDYQVVFGWKQLDFAFPSPAHRQAAIEEEEFIPKNNVITGIKVSGDRIFLTVPRWR